MNDQQIMTLLGSSPNEVNRALTYLQKKMKTIPILRKWILSNGGNLQDFEDVAAEAIFDLYLAIKNLKFRQEVSIATFFMIIAKNKWRSRVPKQKRTVLVDDNSFLERQLSEKTNLITDESKSDSILLSFNKLSAECKEILISYYHDGFSLEAIAHEYGIKYQSAKNKIFRCRAKLREFL